MLHASPRLGPVHEPGLLEGSTTALLLHTPGSQEWAEGSVLPSPVHDGISRLVLIFPAILGELKEHLVFTNPIRVL